MRETADGVKIGIGLPATIGGTDGETVVEWARRAEAAGFASVGVIDRLVYENYEPLVSLAAAAAVTSRVGLLTSILIAPLHSNTPLLAKQAASVDRLSNGRLTLGIGLGSRDDDYETSGLEPRRRGDRIAPQLEELRRIWAGEERGMAGPIGPPPVRSGGPELILAGHVPAAIRRVASHGDGWIYGGSSPAEFAELAAAIDAAWATAGRDGRPRKLSQGYFSLGGGGAAADAYLKDYYRWLGPIADLIAAGALTEAAQVREYLAAHEAAGCDELVLFPCTPDLAEVERLADIVL